MFLENFWPASCDCLVNADVDTGHSRNAEEKNVVFHGEEKNVQSGCSIKLPLLSHSQNYDYLPSSLYPCKTKDITDKKWKWIADSIDCTDDNLFSVEKNN